MKRYLTTALLSLVVLSCATNQLKVPGQVKKELQDLKRRL